MALSSRQTRQRSISTSSLSIFNSSTTRTASRKPLPQAVKYLATLFAGVLLLWIIHIQRESWTSTVHFNYASTTSNRFPNEAEDYSDDFLRILAATPQLSSECARQCLSGSTVVFLGDSTMQESFLDILAKLSGVTDDEEIRAYFLHVFGTRFHPEWMKNLTISQPGPIDTGQWASPMDENNTMPGRVDEEFGAVRVTMLPWGRNMAVTVPGTGMRLIFRFIGHYYLERNHAGIETLTHPLFQDELRYYIQEADVIVFNSFAHNGFQGSDELKREEFLVRYTETVMGTLRRIRESGTKLIYRGPNVRYDGTYIGGSPAHNGMEQRVRESCTAEGIPYVDYRPIIEAFIRTGLCGEKNVCHDHNGHMGATPWSHNITRTCIMSRTGTNWLLKALCSELGRSNC